MACEDFPGAKTQLRCVCAPGKSEEGVAVHLFRAARPFGQPVRGGKPPLLQNVRPTRGRSEEGCLGRLRGVGTTAPCGSCVDLADNYARDKTNRDNFKLVGLIGASVLLVPQKNAMSTVT
jgi:hypothetical protein